MSSRTVARAIDPPTVLSEPVAPTVDNEPRQPRRSLPLGALLGASISLLVAVLIGGLTAFQLHREERREIEARQQLLAEMLAPLAVDIEQAADRTEAEALLASTAHAEIDQGSTDFQLMLCDSAGHAVISFPDRAEAPAPERTVGAQVPVVSSLLPTGKGSLVVWQDDAWLAAEMRLRRHTALFDIGVTALVVMLLVQLIIHFLVTRPMHELLNAIEKFEQGYPVKPRRGARARELHWLEWRFQQLNTNLTNSARLLVAAHRRAMDVSRSRTGTVIDPNLLDPLQIESDRPSAGQEIMQRYLLETCALLERAGPEDIRAREVALQIWDRDSIEAEKLGDIKLRGRIENAAFKILDPDAFDRVNRELDQLVADRTEWCDEVSATISSALDADGVHPVAIQRRTKHPAGIWRKMQEKNLDLEDVADILAFRIIVPAPDDCYLALDAVHRLFDPEPFRFKDYIASPKANGYQSIHTSVRDREGLVFEVQIRTIEMHRKAEQGIAAHWRYHAEKVRYA